VTLFAQACFGVEKLQLDFFFVVVGIDMGLFCNLFLRK
jgi:hypothetical protein